MPGNERQRPPHLRLVPEQGAPRSRRSEHDAERERLLRRAADRAAERPFYLASRLQRYRELEGIDEAELSRRLHAATEAISRLALCRAPDPAHATFRRDVVAVAAHAGVSADMLMQILRRVQVTDAVRRVAEAPELLAARDRVLDKDDAPYQKSSAEDTSEDAPC